MTNEQKTRELYELVWNQRKLELIDDWVTEDFVGHYSASPEPVRGPDGFRRFVADALMALPDLRMTIEETLAADDRVVSRVTMAGTHTGPMRGFAPTGRRVRVGYLAIEHYRDGRCFEEWAYSDDLAMSRQIGALPAAGSAAERIGMQLFALRAARMRRAVRPL